MREDQDRQISLRLSSSLYEALEKRAEDEDLTMAQVIRRSLRRELTREKKR